MKKTTLLVCAMLTVTSAFAQNSRQTAKPQLPPNSFIAKTGETAVEPQGSYTPSFKVDGTNGKVRNVILMIGDGMGLGAVTSAMFANNGELTMTNLQTLGYTRTQSADNFTTDSAASGTAYATGVKTKNGYVGKDPEQNNVANIPEKVAPLGYACGVVSTDDLNGATPAAFFAHNSARGETAAIWADLPASKLVFASAGTMGAFNKLEFATQEAIRKEFTLTGSAAEANAAAATASRLMYLPEKVTLPERGNYLAETTEMAIDYLSKQGKKGFFLMVEGARIDKSEHSNDFKGTVAETLDFDKAIEAAIRFAEKDGHTLVIISADHETGSVTLRKGEPENGYVQAAFASTGHSPMMVPLFAFGPHSKDFSCVQENSDVSNKIVKILGGK